MNDHILHLLIGLGAVAAIGALLIQRSRSVSPAPVDAARTVASSVPSEWQITPPGASGQQFGGLVPAMNAGASYLWNTIGPPVPQGLIPDAGTSGATNTYGGVNG